WRRQRALAARLASLEAQARWYQDALRIAGAGVWQWNMRDNEWSWIGNLFQPAGSSLRYSVSVGDEFYAAPSRASTSFGIAYSRMTSACRRMPQASRWMK